MSGTQKGRAVSIAARIASLALALLAAAPSGVARADPIEVAAEPVPLDRTDSLHDRLGPLRYVGGLVLTSGDGRFGGLSDLVVDGDRITAVSDRGFWLTARVVLDEDAAPTGLADAELFPILTTEGAPVSIDRAEHDAESLARWGDALAVSFERLHRVALHPVSAGVPGRAADIVSLPGLDNAPSNEGVEALAALPDGRLLALSEGLTLAGDRLAGWILDGERRYALTYPKSSWRPTAAAVHPEAGLLVLERRFSPLAGLSARIRRIDPASLVPGTDLDGDIVARFEGSVTTDNYEGLAVSRLPGGKTLIWVLSDDNFIFLQRTLLLAFEWDPQ